MNRFDFSYEEYQKFIVRCPFTDEELKILELRRKGKSIVGMSVELKISTSTVDRLIKSICNKILKEI